MTRKKRFQEETEKVENYWWAKWQVIRREPAYKKDFKELINTIKQDTQKYNLRRVSKDFHENQDLLSRVYFDGEKDLEQIMNSKVIKNAADCENCFPKFNEFRKTWNILFPVDPKIEDLGDEQLLRYPFSYPIEIISHNPEEETITIKIWLKKVTSQKSGIKKHYHFKNIILLYLDGLLKNYFPYTAKELQIPIRPTHRPNDFIIADEYEALCKTFKEIKKINGRAEAISLLNKRHPGFVDWNEWIDYLKSAKIANRAISFNLRDIACDILAYKYSNTTTTYDCDRSIEKAEYFKNIIKKVNKFKQAIISN